MTDRTLPQTGLQTTRRKDNPEVPNNPHYVYTVRLPLETGERVTVEYYDEMGETHQAAGEVCQSFYQHFEAAADDPAPADARYNIIMSPSDDHDSPVLALDSEEAAVSGYIGWISRIETETGGVLYDETENIYPQFDRSVLEQVDGVETGDEVALIWSEGETHNTRHITGTVVERNRGQPMHAVVIKTSEGTLELEYSSFDGSVLVMKTDDSRHRVGNMEALAKTETESRAV